MKLLDSQEGTSACAVHNPQWVVPTLRVGACSTKIETGECRASLKVVVQCCPCRCALLAENGLCSKRAQLVGSTYV